MNEIRILNEDGNLLEDAEGKILAHCIFPDDEASRRQAMLVFRDEKRRFQDAGGLPHYRPTGLVKWIIRSASGDAGQRAVAGYTTVAFALLRERFPDKEHTLYGAANVVVRALKAASKADRKPLKLLQLNNGSWEVAGQRCPSRREGVEKAWIKYCTVSHLIAADSILAEWFPVSSVFERPPERTITLLKTASELEKYMKDAVSQRGQQILSARRNFAGALEQMFAVPLGDEVRKFIMAGVESKLTV